MTSQDFRRQAREAAACAGRRKAKPKSTSGSRPKPGGAVQRARLNAIAPAASSLRVRNNAAGARARAGAEQARGEAPPEEARNAPQAPEEIRKRFHIKRNTWCFPDGVPAFVDRGDRLTTRSEHVEVIESLVAIAQARGWREITIAGADAFRRQMSLAARRAGLTVCGHATDPRMQAEAKGEISHRAPQPAAAVEPELPAARVGASHAPAPTSLYSPMTKPISTPTPHAEAPAGQASREWRGRLIDHGAAPHRNRPGNEISYFVRLHTREGEKNFWSVDLKRALQACLSRPQPGDEVVLRRVDCARRMTRQPGFNGEAGRASAALHSARHRYVIETRDFLVERERLARMVRDASVSAQLAAHRHPQLAGTYLQLRVAQLAAQRLNHPEDQRRFVSLVRKAMADAIARGEPMKILQLRSRASARRAAPGPSVRAAEPLRE